MKATIALALRDKRRLGNGLSAKKADVGPASADRYSDCVQSKHNDHQIRGCTRIIKRGKRESRKNRSISYTYRGNAYEKKKLRDKAIADYKAALEINPSSEWMRKALKRLGVEP